MTEGHSVAALLCTLGNVVDDRWVRCRNRVEPHKTGRVITTWCSTHQLILNAPTVPASYSADMLDLLNDAHKIMVLEVARIRRETLRELYWPPSELEDQSYARSIARLIQFTDERVEVVRMYQHAVGCNATANRITKQINVLRTSKPWRWRRDVDALKRAHAAIIERLNQELES